jgi:hypothetical protein
MFKIRNMRLSIKLGRKTNLKVLTYANISPWLLLLNSTKACRSPLVLLPEFLK